MTDTDDAKPAAPHSPEPWHIEPLVADHGASIAICNRHEGILAVIPPLNEDDEPDEATAQRDPHDAANARRMVAAVNACQGIGTEALEQGVVRELLEALETAGYFLERFYVQAVASRDDKRFELERWALGQARAAIARATGGRP